MVNEANEFFKKVLSLFLLGNIYKQYKGIYSKLLLDNPFTNTFKSILASIFKDIQKLSQNQNGILNRMNLFVYSVVLWKILRFLFSKFQSLRPPSNGKKIEKTQTLREKGSVPSFENLRKSNSFFRNKLQDKAKSLSSNTFISIKEIKAAKRS